MPESDHIRLAVHDFGGSGTPILLLHGAGANLTVMKVLGQELSSRFRVVTADLRGHGRSGDGPWEWPAVLGDLEHTCERLGLYRPAVVGWSLGGMIAAMWAEEHPECPAAVSVDGTPPPVRPDQCPGLDPDRAKAELVRLHAAFSAMSSGQAESLAPEDIDTAIEAHRAMARRNHGSEDMAVEGFLRNLRTRDGRTFPLPLPVTLDRLRTAMESLDVISIYRRARCPLLIALATRDLPRQQPFHDLYAAYRRGFEEHLAEVTEENPSVTVAHIEGAGHDIVTEKPAELTRLITEFIG